MRFFYIGLFIILFSSNFILAADPTLYDVLSEFFNLKKSVIFDSLNNIYSSDNKTILLTDGEFFIDKDIHGNIIVYNGKLILSDTSRVFGSIFFYNEANKNVTISKNENYRYRRYYRKYHKPSFNCNFIYNRVQGIFINFYYGKDLYDDEKIDYIIYPYFEIGYGFANKKLDYKVQLMRKIYKNNGIGLSFQDKVMSNDYWLYSLNENTLSSILIKEDYFDYFNRRGGSVFIKGKNNLFSYTLSYDDDTYKGVKKHTNWSIFGGNKKFKENVDFPDIHLKTFYADFKLKPNKLIYLGMDFEKSFDSDYDYSMGGLDLKMKYALSFYDELSLWVKFKSSTGDLPYFKTMYLGGYNVLKAYNFKEFACSRFLYGSVEYAFRLKDFFSFSVDKVVLFGEIALFDKNFGKYDSFFSGFNDYLIKTDIGLGFFIEDNIRLDVSRRNDRDDENIKFSIRFYNLF